LHLVPPLPAARQLGGERREHRLVLPPGLRRRAVTAANQEPVLLLAVEVRRDERPHAAQPLAVEPHGQLAVTLLLDELVRAVIPDLDAPGAVLPGRDLAGERGVLERMVLDVDRERPRARLEWDALGHRPGGEGAVPLEAEVV